MRSVIKIVTILAFLGSRGAIAQTVGLAGSPAASSSTAAGLSSLAQDAHMIGEAPIGHRQPRGRDVPSQNSSELERLSPEDAAVDRKLSICRGC